MRAKRSQKRGLWFKPVGFASQLWVKGAARLLPALVTLAVPAAWEQRLENVSRLPDGTGPIRAWVLRLGAAPCLPCLGLDQVSQISGWGWTGGCPAPPRWPVLEARARGVGRLRPARGAEGQGAGGCSPSAAGVGPVEPDFLDTCLTRALLQSFTGTLCPGAAKDVFNLKLNVIGAVGLVAVIMIFGMIFSVFLCCATHQTRTAPRAPIQELMH
uniref:Uncharacterized protein n=1 Tax=Athene cunicularia TaxID=194338 RepID=A0A663LL39_ATHCN